MLPQVLSIQISDVQPLWVPRGTERVQVMSGIRKHAISTINQPTPVAVKKLGLQGDEQADLSVHGGLDKAVYVYPVECYPRWEAELSQIRQTQPSADGLPLPLPLGAFGENLTVSGIQEEDVWIGDRWQLGSCVLRVESPRRPCYKFSALLGWPGASRYMMQHGLTGWYMSVEQPGEIRAGDTVQVIAGNRQTSLTERIRQMTRRVDLRDD